MLIANPLYDVAFEKLMEDRRVAKFFIDTLISEKVVDLKMPSREFTRKDGSEAALVFRRDFTAFVETAEGKIKKILVEVRKAKSEVGLDEFGNEPGDQYGEFLPIKTIYVLGFDLSNMETPCFKVGNRYFDMVKGKVSDVKSDFLEMLMRDSYVVQTKKITDRYATRLDKLLSVFEQRHFLKETRAVKDYRHSIDDEEIRRMTDILHHLASDHEGRTQVEKEAEA